MTDQKFLAFLDKRRSDVFFQYGIYLKIRNRLCINGFGFLALSIVFFHAFTMNPHAFFLLNILTFLCTGLTLYCFYRWISLVRNVRIRVGPDTELPPRQAFAVVSAEYEMVKNASLQRR